MGTESSERGKEGGDAHLPLGAILAGGASRRFGEPKALALVGGVPMAERARRAVAPSTCGVVLVTNDPALGAALGHGGWADQIADVDGPSGPLAGIRTALLRARELGCPGVFVLACDLPLVADTVVRLLVARFLESPDRVVLPESEGPLGMEPLCACYPVTWLETDLAHQDRSVAGLLARLPSERVPLSRIRRLGDPKRFFLNVNTPEDHGTAERWARNGFFTLPEVGKPEESPGKVHPSLPIGRGLHADRGPQGSRRNPGAG